jgi:hypothetical protein
MVIDLNTHPGAPTAAQAREIIPLQAGSWAFPGGQKCSGFKHSFKMHIIGACS